MQKPTRYDYIINKHQKTLSDNPLLREPDNTDADFLFLGQAENIKIKIPVDFSSICLNSIFF